MIGNAKMCSGLYILKVGNLLEQQRHKAESDKSNQQPAKLSSFSRSNNDSAVMLWHYRLGHPNFVYLQRLVRSLFSNKSPKDFQCEICQFAKHIRSPYSIQL